MEPGWHLHIGAHKTATTHLQESLEAVRPVLDAQGVGFASLSQIRPMRAIDLRLRRPQTWMGGSSLRREIEQRLSTRLVLRPRMILSEEDILGNAAGPVHRGFYPWASMRMRALASALLTGGAGSLWLSIRSFDRFLPAAYATALKHLPLSIDAATLRRRTLARPPDWSDLVARLRHAAPGTPITVWDYGDYRKNRQAIMEMLTGLTFSEIPDIPDPSSTRTPDPRAILEAESLARDLPLPERADRIGQIYERATGSRFSLFSKAEAERLRDLHSRQIERIASIEGVRFLSF